MRHSSGISVGSPRPPDFVWLVEGAVDLHSDLDVIDAPVVDDYVPPSGDALRAQNGPNHIESGNDVPPEGTAARGLAASICT